MKILLVGEGLVRVTLTQGLFAIINEQDLELVAERNWYADVGPWNIYAKSDSPYRVRLHSLIMSPIHPLIVHHKDGDGLNNTRDNLEIMTQREHVRLSRLRSNKRGSFYRGVYWHRARSKYVAEIWVDYKKNYLGIFESAEDAARAYDTAALNLLGPEKFIPNFPVETDNGN